MSNKPYKVNRAGDKNGLSQTLTPQIEKSRLIHQTEDTPPALLRDADTAISFIVGAAIT